MNSVTLTGRLGSDPEKKENRVTFSIATNDGYGDKKKTNWHNCVAFGKSGDILAEFAKKGDNLSVSGHLDYFKSEKGVTYCSIIVEKFTLLGGKKQEAEPTKEQMTQESLDDNQDLPF